MKMESEKEWDVEQYKMEHECDEHWELRRRFLLAHKDSFPEDELVCLAQVFTNIEFLGCRYPEETMQLVAELSQEIAADYREKQKSKLQRTFVKASDAAGAKAKGLIISKPDNSGNKSDNSSKMVGAQDRFSNTDFPMHKRIKFDHIRPTKNHQKQRANKQFTNDGPFGNIVLVEHSENKSTVSILTDAVNASGQNLEWIFKEDSTGCKCEIKINSKTLTEACGGGKKIAKKNAADIGVAILKKYYHTIQVKKLFHGESEKVVRTESISNASPVENILSNDNIGRKLMLLMGWNGGGLGKSQQGIVNPVTVTQRVSREGLGLKSEQFNQNIMKKKFQTVLRNYLNGDTRTDLVFSSEFTNEERAVIHQVARQMGVKSHSHGPKDARTLVISRKIDLFELVAELKEMGGSTEKYELIIPEEGDNPT
ncbi:NF-kappa-B-repressing factor [Neodiprion pinetum]|uniref:NF-kappa-B-repressing factor n=1 Tax=Neodiprion lecontei TaxID=441921 RepID=A0A6J0BFX3_NEOLC|nr:NF-kappa-B-repressing factor [Neodiprion lecontei]XP_046477159.1 NF-kappa-B-repressing factor [Neodiprion pinetum]XP_046615975.1 NF-kappa-B-repressing factor [Neodiprion virginianus]